MKTVNFTPTPTPTPAFSSTHRRTLPTKPAKPIILSIRRRRPSPPHAALAETLSLDTTSSAATVAVAAIAAAATLTLTDPERRRRRDAEKAGGVDEKMVVKNYFDTTGFNRWRKIYGDTDDVSSVQLDIRQGHAHTVDKVLRLMKNSSPNSESGLPLAGMKVCDAGCGTGSLAIPLAAAGAVVSASDISDAMVEEARRRAAAEAWPAGAAPPVFETRELESLTGSYDTVACLDVLIHYPEETAASMISHLASLAEKRLILSFAPKTLYYVVLKRIGELFPGASKATRAYLHSEEEVEKALRENGWVVQSRDLTATKFYFSTLFEAVPASSYSAP
eukprot:TRINITY_DN2020_c0_g1_i1.p1 TRINITY_DN2020_c0_g1~~TRINITY_DN2020_c0_g1_i1.p1  ORF type:complete len:334 (-),score=-23.46 TRINITY_DN2020_c0_g1_i1:130-1131(-)